MARVKRGKTANKRRKNILKQAKGFLLGRKSKYRLAKQALMKAWEYAYRDRRVRKREFRKLWQIRIGNAAKEFGGISYNKFIYLLKKSKISLNRKILSKIAVEYPQIFKKIMEEIKNK